MKPMLSTICLGRSARLTAIAIGLSASLGAGFAPTITHAADQRLDDALAALQKAEALLEESQAGSVPEKVEKRFARHVERAISLILRAMDQIEAAKDTVDNP
jgi:uncharacterized protein with LGFP repeats